MTTRAVAEFFIKAEHDATLARRIAAIPAIDKVAWAEDIALLAGEIGFRFGAGEIDAAVAEQQRLSAELGEDELGQVAGGARNHPDFAWLPPPVSTTFYEAWPCKWNVPMTG
jgi:hypothetical protein